MRGLICSKGDVFSLRSGLRLERDIYKENGCLDFAFKKGKVRKCPNCEYSRPFFLINAKVISKGERYNWA